MKKLGFLLILVWSVGAQAQMWVATQRWDSSWQNRYTQWIAGSVGPNFFKELGGEYAKLKIDCADAHYALKVYFSYQHGLEFSVNGGSITNNTTQFDHLRREDQKLTAFIKYLAAHLGTESLSHKDTYPVSVRDVKPGDIFMYKVGTNGNFTRHTYIIKNINIDGTFDVMYSTQDRMRKGLPLNRHKSYMFTKAPVNGGVDRNHWGFRRAKMPQHASVAQESLGFADFSQYELARRLGNLGFFREVRKIHQSVKESPNMMAKRNFETICNEVKDRVDIVTNGVRFVKKVGGRCLNYQEYDTYSTPSRDSGIMDNYRNFELDYKSIVQNGQAGKVDPSLFQNASVIFSSNVISGSGAKQVYQACPVNTGVGGVNLASFKQALFAKRVSFHPNDSEGLRWGLSNGQRTRCQEFYGYPN